MKTLISLFFFVSLLMTSCALQRGYLLFSGKKDEIIATQMIKDFMRTNQKPSIVLKAPNSENRSTQSDPNAYIYGAIEKELLIAGFDVKDRSLFNEVIGKSKEVDYSEIKRLTGTELILELVSVSTDIKFSTNKYYRTNNKESVTDNNFTKYGAVIEFKLTLIEKNQFAGSYTFFYTPCTAKNNDCECQVAYKILPPKFYPRINLCNVENNTTKSSYEYVSQDVMTEFVRNGVKLMITEIRK